MGVMLHCESDDDVFWLLTVLHCSVGGKDWNGLTWGYVTEEVQSVSDVINMPASQ